MAQGQALAGPAAATSRVRGYRAAAFYTDRLGLRRAPASPPGAIVFDTTPVAFAVRDPLPGVDLDTDRPGQGVALWLYSTDAQALHDTLDAAGVPIVAPPFDSPFGRTFTFTDPDGYAITIHDKR